MAWTSLNKQCTGPHIRLNCLELLFATCCEKEDMGIFVGLSEAEQELIESKAIPICV